MGRFEWSEKVPGKIRALVADDGNGVIEEGEGSIADVKFDVKGDVLPGTSELVLSDVVIADKRNAMIPASANNGFFVVPSNSPCGSDLCVGQAYRWPGSTDVVVPIMLNMHGRGYAAMQFDLLFDRNVLHVIRVDKTDRTALMDIFNFNHIQGGIRVAATGIGHRIEDGPGPVVNIVVRVAEGAAPGSYWMEFMGVVLADPLGIAADVSTEGNWFTIPGGTEVESTETEICPQDFALGQNYPNPFNPQTTITYTLPVQSTKSKVEGDGSSNFEPSTSYITLKIFNVLGQEVRTMVDEYQGPGYYTVAWDGRDESGSEVPCGIYFYRLSVDGGQWTETKRMVLLK